MYVYSTRGCIVMKKLTMEKNDNFVNRKGEVLKVETEGIPNLWVRQGINFFKKS